MSTSAAAKQSEIIVRLLNIDMPTYLCHVGKYTERTVNKII